MSEWDGEVGKRRLVGRLAKWHSAKNYAVLRKVVLNIPTCLPAWQSERLLSEREASIAAQEAGAADEGVKLAELRRGIEGEKRRVEAMKEEAQQALDKAAAAQAVSQCVNLAVGNGAWKREGEWKAVRESGSTDEGGGS